MLSDLEEFLKNKGYQNLKKFFDDRMKYSKIKISGTKIQNEKKKMSEVLLKSRICFIREIIEKNGFEIFLKNLWETFGMKKKTLIFLFVFQKNLNFKILFFFYFYFRSKRV